jgi:hypothetical protein
MRFPLRLTAALYSRKLRRGIVINPIVCVSPLANHINRILHQEQVTRDLEWQTPEACVAAANRANAAVVWLGHAEPLLHPNIGKVVAALLQSGRYVFLHTSGVGLRKRIHEFQPHSRLFLTIELSPGANGESAAYPVTQKANALGASLEAIDCAGLSGFFRCVHVTVGAQTDAAATARRFKSLNAIGLEGFAVSSERSPAISAEASILKKVVQIRDAIPSRGWRNFSRILEQSRHPLQQRRLAALESSDRAPLPPCETICEENALTS